MYRINSKVKVVGSSILSYDHDHDLVGKEATIVQIDPKDTEYSFLVQSGEDVLWCSVSDIVPVFKRMTINFEDTNFELTKNFSYESLDDEDLASLLDIFNLHRDMLFQLAKERVSNVIK